MVAICTAQWSLYVPHSGHYMYCQFDIQQFYFLPTQCIYVFCVDLRTNSDYFLMQHQLTGFYNREGECLLRGTDWVFKHSRIVLSFRGANRPYTKPVQVVVHSTLQQCWPCYILHQNSARCVTFYTKTVQAVLHSTLKQCKLFYIPH